MLLHPHQSMMLLEMDRKFEAKLMMLWGAWHPDKICYPTQEAWFGLMLLVRDGELNDVKGVAMWRRV